MSKNVGYGKLEKVENEYKPYIFVMEYDKKGLEQGGVTLLEGRMPENSNEIVIPEHLIKSGRINYTIGEKITLNLGKRQTKDGLELTQEDALLTDESEETESSSKSKSETEDFEEIVDTKEHTYTIVGIIERSNYKGIEGFSAPGYTAISYMDNENDINTANISVLYSNLKDFQKKTEDIKSVIEKNIGSSVTVSYNSSLIDYEGGVSDTTMASLYSVGAVVIIIIILSSVFVIRNSFSISVSEKTKQYGMLSSIGATKKQIKKSVLYEGFYIGIIGIPLGILCGMLAVVILLQVVNVLLGDSLNEKCVFSIPILAIIASIVISAITIYLSCILPARRASKISPIEAIRGNDDIKIKAKKVKTSKITKKLFGIGGVIASKNLKRNKKKYRTTVISLVVSISIFISLSSFLDYGGKIVNVYYKDLGYDISVYNGTVENYNEITKLDNVEEYSYSYMTEGSVDINKYGSEFGKRIAKDNEETNNITIILINNDYFKKFIEHLGIQSTNYKDIAILEDDAYEYIDEKTVFENYYSLKTGDSIEITLTNGEKRTVKISKKTDERPMGYKNVYSNGGYLFVSEDFIQDKSDKKSFHVGSLLIKSQNPDELENEINNLKKTNNLYSKLYINNISKYVEENQKIILLISIFLYGFIAVITLIGVTNIFNTITTNMILRSKEFANLKSVGMTTKEFNRMIRLESILYGLKSLLIGIPLGLIGSYCIYNGIAKGLDFGYILPLKSIIIAIIFVFIIVGLTMKYSLNKINKQNIIETIREDNI
ncbi:aBC-type transport system involved in lipoprotein release permease component [Clostridium sp. CAG:492]|nr:aBC-type transport system involved in lipoprotein release permease component [Clostridium sp. CAG:492]